MKCNKCGEEMCFINTNSANGLEGYYRCTCASLKSHVKDDSIFEIRRDLKSIIAFEGNGDIFVKGELVENDKQLVDGFREFLKKEGLYPKE